MLHARTSGGFALIDLTIVAALTAIVAAIAVPQYQACVVRAQACAGLAEIVPGRTAYEALVKHGITSRSRYVNVVNLGLPSNAPHCAITATAPASGKGLIRCVLKGSPAVSGSYIDLVRNASGTWSCLSNLKASYLPRHCSTG